MYNPENPLIVQSDHTVLVEVDSPHYAQARDALVRFAELIKSPEHIHTYRITPLSIWNACAAGVTDSEITGALSHYAKYPVPDHIAVQIREFASRYGRVQLIRDEHGIVLQADDGTLATEMSHHKTLRPLLGEQKGHAFRIDPGNRGKIKQVLIKIGYPAEDLAGYTSGEMLPISLRGTSLSGASFALRHYQTAAVDAFHAGGASRGGSGVIVLPCGAGKTIVGMAAIAQLQTSTLILVTNTTSIRQWIDEILDKTTIQPDQIGEYSGAQKNIRPITVSTYQIMTHRKSVEDDFVHLELFDKRNWGLIIYDEVHLLPAPVFQITAGLQARRRLGLTATLVREDEREDDVFALIGPKKADVPWKELESEGWIAKARCTEIRVPLPDKLKMKYAMANARTKFRIASENTAKHSAIYNILEQHPNDRILIIGMYIDQLKQLAAEMGAPLLTGSTGQKRRDMIFKAFKDGEIPVLIVSKIANFSVDLPDASVAIQISGMFGSRQEEAQRLGRILRPKPGANQAFFYTIVSHDTREQDFALKRQLFLCEQGYEYHIEFPGQEKMQPVSA